MTHAIRAGHKRSKPSKPLTVAGFDNGIRRNTLLTLALWTVLVLFCFAWNLLQQEDTIIAIAKVQAIAVINKDLAVRSWASSHGGVYVKPTADTSPNPYLKIPNRDVVTTNGVALTLMNPAYITREIQSRFAQKFDVLGHMTSLQLLNPANAPDAWERAGLTQFAQGNTDDYVGLIEYKGKPYLKLMKPMFMEESCIACHQWTGLKVGDVRGGISAAIPIGPLREQASQGVYKLALSLGGLWLLGTAGIGLVCRIKLNVQSERRKSDAELERLYQDATHDSLTGLFNRRYLDDVMDRQFERSRRDGTPLCVAMLDIDHFKSFNDRYGHRAGDDVLRALGNCLREGLRRGDVACRYGGEEFVIIMSGAHARDAELRLKTLTESIRDVKILGKHGAVLPHVTVSIGLAECVADDARSSENLLSLADKALYRAKAEGRDRIVFTSNLSIAPQ